MTASPAARDLRLALTGAAALAAAMGIGRFAYTALLPAAQRALGFDDRTAGLIASANLAGYLAGALAARAAPAAIRVRAFRAGLAATALLTGLTAVSEEALAWGAVRCAVGMASALVFVLGSAMVLEAAADRPRVSGLLYSGVGVGIATSGVASVVLASAGWRTPWIALAALAAALVVPASIGLPARSAARTKVDRTRDEPAAGVAFGFGRLAAAYFLEGLGYIVSGTFAVTAAQRIPAIAPHAPWVWVVAGLAGAPSALLWMRVGRRAGERSGLVAALAIQALGMALPALSGSAAAAILGAALFGGTFMGVTALTMSAAGKLDPDRPGRGIGTLTVLYGVGQVLGPALAGALSRRLGDPRPAVLAAAVAVLIAAAILGSPGGAPRRAGS